MNAYELGQLSRRARDSEAFLNRRSVQFRKKKQLYEHKPHHIQALNGKVINNFLPKYYLPLLRNSVLFATINYALSGHP